MISMVKPSYKSKNVVTRGLINPLSAEIFLKRLFIYIWFIMVQKLHKKVEKLKNRVHKFTIDAHFG